MKKLVLLSLSAMCCPMSAHALEISSNRLGDAHLVPVYDVTGDRATMFRIRNHGGVPSAVRIVIAEGGEGREVLGFNAYIEQNDSWSGALVKDETGAVKLVSSDKSCVLGLDGAAGTELRLPENGTMQQLERGSIEVIEAGGLLTTIDSAGPIPEDRLCAEIAQRAAGIWQEHPNDELGPGPARLEVDAYIVDTVRGSSFDTHPIAIQYFNRTARHQLPGTGHSVRLTDPQLSPQENEYVVQGASLAYRVPKSRAADAASLLFMSLEARGTFEANEQTGSSTEIVVSFPTRHAYVADAADGPLPPFDNGMESSDGSYCNATKWTLEAQPSFPRMSVDMPLCGSVSSTVVETGARLAGHARTEGLTQGQLRADFTTRSPRIDADIEGNLGVVVEGLPVIVTLLTEVRGAASFGFSERAIQTD